MAKHLTCSPNSFTRLSSQASFKHGEHGKGRSLGQANDGARLRVNINVVKAWPRRQAGHRHHGADEWEDEARADGRAHVPACRPSLRLSLIHI